MLISEAISQLSKILRERGDLPLITGSSFGGFYEPSLQVTEVTPECDGRYMSYKRREEGSAWLEAVEV